VAEDEAAGACEFDMMEGKQQSLVVTRSNASALSRISLQRPFSIECRLTMSDEAVPRIPDIHLAQLRFTLSQSATSESARKAAVDELVKGIERDGECIPVHTAVPS
jgi:hypothetical protein